MADIDDIERAVMADIDGTHLKLVNTLIAVLTAANKEHHDTDFVASAAVAAAAAYTAFNLSDRHANPVRQEDIENVVNQFRGRIEIALKTHGDSG